MNIDISNYEEYLLNAVDGELSGEEMAALEVFLQQHPHIREEMALLESVKLVPDVNVQFDAKDSLYHESIQMLDYVDNELHGAERLAFEELIRGDVFLSKELNLLQQARLQPDLNLQFSNKEILYRHNRTSIRPIWWWSAAAAVVAGVAIWVLPVLPGKESAQVAVNKQSVTGSNQQLPAGNNLAESQQPGSLAQTSTDSLSREKQLLASGDVKPAEQGNTGVNGRPGASVNSNGKPGVVNKTGLPVNGLAVNSRPGSNKSGVPANGVFGKPVLTPGKSGIVVSKPAIALNKPTLNKPVSINPILADNSNPGLSKLAQPVTTSGEVVKQLQDKLNEQAAAIANPVQTAPVLANATAINTNNNVATNTNNKVAIDNKVATNKLATSKVAEIVTAPAPVQGELVVSVTMNGDSKLLNGVANVARFFSKKKK